MKRCPQCEFIYEDDQSLCDMDGALLVFDARSLPNLHALAPVEVPLVAPKAHWRHRTFPAMAALILATLLSMVYFVSTQRTAPAPAPLPLSGASIATPIENPVAPASDTNQTPPPAADAAALVNGAAVKEDRKPEPEKTNTRPSPAAKKATAKTSATQPKPAEEPKKEDSKVGSILKKTGRILKKPFKF